MAKVLEAVHISSLQNPRVKSWLQLTKGTVRNRGTLFLVEGTKECERGILSQYPLEELILCPELVPGEWTARLNEIVPGACPVLTVDKKVYARLSYRKESEGVIGVFRKKDVGLKDVVPDKSGMNLYLILENIEKPGNLGAVLRTADGVGARGVILTGNSTDQYNPNAIRASLGTVFSVPVIYAGPQEIVDWTRQNGIRMLSAALPSYKPLYDIHFEGPTALIFGSEDIGLSPFWPEVSEMTFTIPMNGIADSLNLSVSVSIASYEFLRQYIQRTGR